MASRARLLVALGAVTILVTSCGGSDADESDQVSGVDESGQQDEESEQEEDEAEENADDGIERPEIIVPDDLDNKFEKIETSDSTEKEILADNERYVESLDEAVAHDESDGAMTFYMTGEALEINKSYVGDMKDDNLRYGGVIEYYNREVSSIDGEFAEVDYCVDASESYTINTETGEEAQNPGEIVFYSMLMTRNDQGVWQTSHIEAEMGAATCV